jgi:molybdopterin molybdotransferase
MDGVAINFSAWESGKRTFKIENIQLAGSPQKELQNAENCIEAMTGAILPKNTDTVIRYEDTETTSNGNERFLTIKLETLNFGKNVHKQGTDKQKGDVIVEKGCRIGAAEIGVAASVGKSEILVSKLPKIAVIATGDELVAIDQKPLPHQIRKSNIYSIQAGLQQLGIQCSLYHLADSKAILTEKLAEILTKYDAIVLSGGVSMGKADFVPEVLTNLGVQKLFHKIKQRPGKPFWFGKTPNGKAVFALPGNPVSTFMCFYKYVKPWILQSSKLKTNNNIVYAILSENITFNPALTYFLQVTTVLKKKRFFGCNPDEGQRFWRFSQLDQCKWLHRIAKQSNRVSSWRSVSIY